MDTSTKKESSFEPGYIRLHRNGELAKRIEAAQKILEDCTLCPWHCHVNRPTGEKGICQTGAFPMVSSYGPHFGEERPLVGRRGSGTIFLSYCNLKCIFCQNYDIILGGDAGTSEFADAIVERLASTPAVSV